jgi:2-polyprenyl-3-methyl-5-hydroxy-6-metoxy-1,4-benzoquinol methylase
MPTEVSRVQRRQHWEERHAEGDIESSEPNPVLAATVSGLTPGSALDLACGDGRNAVWLASRGWRVTGVDWSETALAKAAARAEAAGLTVEWLKADLLAWNPPSTAFELVTVVYLHLPVGGRRQIYAAAAQALVPGGRLVVIGHDRTNLADGVGGPQDPALLFTAAEIGAELLEDVADLTIESHLVVRRVRAPERRPIDALLVARRSAARRSSGSCSRTSSRRRC